tara:strand:+ start:218 stop:976 length:759 start_codon:yes stop_codon:yes gene_type:complete
MIEILILSLVQGITEFLPISSSAHLVMFSKYLNFDDQSLTIDVSLHIGSFIAVVTYFYKDIINFINNKKLFLKIFISSIPVMLVGFFLVQSNLIEKIRSVEIIGWTTLIFGMLLYISDKFKLNKNIKSNFNYKSALIIGLFQILSLIPGVSRSGITITAARLLNFKRYDSLKISFLLSVPTLAAVSIYGLKNLISKGDIEISILSIISIILSFLFSFMTIKYFFKYVQKFNMNIFVIYRLILGLILIYLSYL